MRLSLTSQPVAAFPNVPAGRLPHSRFRGLLSVHSRCGPHGRWITLGDPFHRSASNDVVTSIIRSDCYRLERQFAGRDSHPLSDGAFPRHTVRNQEEIWPWRPGVIADSLISVMRICTWNVGGLKGGVTGAMPWLRRNRPDIVGFQEASERGYKSAVSELRSEGYYCASHIGPVGDSVKGVAILSKHPLEVTQEGLLGQEARGARLLTASTAGLSFTTVCVPTASARTACKRKMRLKQKLAWLDALNQYLCERKTADASAILCGDFNINPTPIDNYYHWENRRERKGSFGFGEDERSRISSLLDAGWNDLVREMNPDTRMFSWWSSPDFYMRDKGLRIDHVFGNAAIVKRCRSAWIDRDHYDDRGRTGPPDHAPVVVDLT